MQTVKQKTEQEYEMVYVKKFKNQLKTKTPQTGKEAIVSCMPIAFIEASLNTRTPILFLITNPAYGKERESLSIFLIVVSKPKKHGRHSWNFKAEHADFPGKSFSVNISTETNSGAITGQCTLLREILQ